MSGFAKIESSIITLEIKYFCKVSSCKLSFEFARILFCFIHYRFFCDCNGKLLKFYNLSQLIY